MSHGFKTLKGKIQFLFDKMDAREKVLSVEMDLLKAYLDALSKEIEQNGEELLELFPYETENTLTSSASIPVEIEMKKSIVDVEKQEVDKNEKIVVNHQNEVEDSIDRNVSVDDTLETSEAEVIEEKEPFSEVQETNETIIELEKDQEQDNCEVESETDFDNLADEEIEEEKPSIDQPEEIITEEHQQLKHEAIVETKEEENEDDYGIGLKFKQSKPLGELIDLSEKYVFIQGLFNQDPDRFSKALRRMDEATSMDEALTILDDYVVGNDAELMQKLKAYLRIRFA